MVTNEVFIFPLLHPKIMCSLCSKTLNFVQADWNEIVGIINSPKRYIQRIIAYFCMKKVLAPWFHC